MHNFTYTTPSELVRKHPDGINFQELKRRSRLPDKECENCNQLAWKYADNGLCFSCTTGESDASEDYELVPE